jgi:L-ascorbate metabolism protein UlaG (beta-lactamase superfamily)
MGALRFRRLGWAGVEIESAGQTLLMDYINADALLQYRAPLSETEQRFVHPPKMSASAAVCSHLHSDHADPVALKGAAREDATVFRPEKYTSTGADLVMTDTAENLFAESGLKQEILQPWEERQVGPFRIVAAPAVDGFGHPQRSWFVESGGVRVLHAGDTMNHGYWWSIAHRLGPMDVVFLPINGPVVTLPFCQPPSPLHAAMNPEEAAVAAHILGARVAVPVHYEVLNDPTWYAEVPSPAKRFEERTRGLEVASAILPLGEWRDAR